MRAVQAPIIPVVGELIRRHPGTISFGQGVVHYGPPPEATDRVSDFLADPENHKYKAVEGIGDLRTLMAHKLMSENGIALEPDRELVVTAGANMAFMNAILAITDPGDEVIIQTPYYFNHEMAITMADCTAVPVPTDANYQLDLEAIRGAITPRTRAVVTISPNNPTGAVYVAAALGEVNRICARSGIYHISDEAYEYFTFGGASHFSPGSIKQSAEHTISLYSLSKAYGFASWRIGYMVLPKHLFFAVKKVQDTIVICPPVISQTAAVGALRAGPEHCRQMLEGYAQVRHLVLDELKAIDNICTVPRADGAFYFLLRLDTDRDPMELVQSLVQDYGVAVIPGTTFGMDRGCYLRISYGALTRAAVAEGIGRLVRGLKNLIGGS